MKKQIPKPVIAIAILAIVSLGIVFAMKRHQSDLYYGEVQSDSCDICTSVPGTIQEINVKEGDSVSADATVMKLDASEATLNYQKALLAEDTARLQALKTSSPAREEELRIQYNTIKQLQEQKNTLNNSLEKANIAASQAELNLETLEETWQLKQNRYSDLEQLVKQGFESKQNLDLAQTELTGAKNAYESARLQLDSLKKDTASLQSQITSMDLQVSSAHEKWNLMKSGLDTNDQQAAENASQMAQLDRQRSELLLSKYDIKSAVAGVVESVNFEKGEFVNTGAPVVSVIDPAHRHITIYLPERALPKIKTGDTLKLSLVSDESVVVSGTVSTKSETAMFTPVNIVTTKDRDRLVFPVEISLAASDRIAPGMLLKVTLSGGE